MKKEYQNLKSTQRNKTQIKEGIREMQGRGNRGK